HGSGDEQAEGDRAAEIRAGCPEPAHARPDNTTNSQFAASAAATVQRSAGVASTRGANGKPTRRNPVQTTWAAAAMAAGAPSGRPERTGEEGKRRRVDCKERAGCEYDCSHASQRERVNGRTPGAHDHGCPRAPRKASAIAPNATNSTQHSTRYGASTDAAAPPAEIRCVIFIPIAVSTISQSTPTIE